MRNTQEQTVKKGWIKRQISREISDFKSIIKGDENEHFFSIRLFGIAAFIGGLGFIQHGIAHAMIMFSLALNLGALCYIYSLLLEIKNKK